MSNQIRTGEFEGTKDVHEHLINVLLRDIETGEIIGDRWITKGALARALQPLTRNCHEAINGKFVLEV